MQTENMVAGVVVAAGWGNFNGQPKVLKSLVPSGDCPMVAYVVRTVNTAGLSPIIVIVNSSTGGQVKKCLEQSIGGAIKFYCVDQFWRFGAADATSRAMPLLEHFGIKHFLALYADMPLWSPWTLRRLVRGHLRAEAKISMVSVKITGKYRSVLERYGRILRGENGRIVAVVEPGDANSDQLKATKTVNPSLWVIETEWFKQALHKIPPRSKGDDFPPERHMPHLVAIADSEGAMIHEMPLRDKRQALGVNTLDELEEAREIYSQRAKERGE